MEDSRRLSGFLMRLAVIAAAVFLFACGGPAREPSETPSRAAGETGDRPSQASMASVEPAPEADAQLTSQASTEMPSTGPEQTAGLAPAAPEPEAPAPAAPATGGHRVFTNKDLERYKRVKEEFGLSDDRVTVDLSRPAASDKQKEESQDQGPPLTDEQREEEIRTTREKIVRLTEEAEYLKKRIPSLHNPLLPRAQLSEPDKISEAGMDNVERLDKVTARLAEVDAELNSLQRRFAELSQMKKPAGSSPSVP